jgi:hypothetical protein
MQHARPPAGQAGAMRHPVVDAVAAGLDPDDRHLRVIEERMEQPHGVRAAADAGDQRVGQAALRLQHLLARLLADDRLEIAHHGRIGMRARHGADAVEGVARHW